VLINVLYIRGTVLYQRYCFILEVLALYQRYLFYIRGYIFITNHKNIDKKHKPVKYIPSLLRIKILLSEQ